MYAAVRGAQDPGAVIRIEGVVRIAGSGQDHACAAG